MYVSSDMNEKEAVRAYASPSHGPWLMLDRKDPLVEKLKKKYGIWAGREAGEFGRAGRRHGVPTLIAVAPDGTELQLLDTEGQGGRALVDVTAEVWPAEPPLEL